MSTDGTVEYDHTTGLIPLTWDELANVAYQLDPEGHKLKAIAFAVRAGHTDDMASRFLAQLCAEGKLGMPHFYGETLAYVMTLKPEDTP